MLGASALSNEAAFNFSLSKLNARPITRKEKYLPCTDVLLQSAQKMSDDDIIRTGIHAACCDVRVGEQSQSGADHVQGT